MAGFNLTATSNNLIVEHTTGAPASLVATSSLSGISDLTQVNVSFNFDINPGTGSYTDGSPNSGVRFTASLYDYDTSTIIDNAKFEYLHQSSSIVSQSAFIKLAYTGSTINTPQLRFNIDAPQANPDGALNLEFRDITVTYKDFSIKYGRLFVDTRKEMPGYYYFSFKNEEEVFSNLDYNLSSDTLSIGFITDHNERFKFQDYDILGGQAVNLRKSNFILEEDNTSYSGSSIYPQNYSFISSSYTDGNINKIPSRLFASIQDSNYSSKSWTRGRYEGSNETNKNVLGEEPAITLKSFKGLIFDEDAERDYLTQFFTSSNVERVQDDVKDIYYYVLGAGRIPESPYTADAPGYDSTFFEAGASTPNFLQYSYFQDEDNFILSNDGTIKRYEIFLLEKSTSSKTGFQKIANSKVVNFNKNFYYKTDSSGSIDQKFSGVLST